MTASTGAEAEKPKPKPKRAFLSYAWEDDAYQKWVEGLATRLRANGVDARLDAWHLPRNGNIAEFMTREIRMADWVLVLCSPLYQAKVRATEDGQRVAGVGWETRLLTGGMLADNTNKVLAVLTRGTWSEAAPDALKGQFRFDLSDNTSFERNYRALLQEITGTTQPAPSLGQLPLDLGVKAIEPLHGSDRHGVVTTWKTTLGLALAIDVLLAGFATLTLSFSTTGFLQYCAMFGPVALVIAVSARSLASVVRRRWKAARL